ncbi:hypothetical protein EDEG_00519 [Edhazardia aedis USNM 41457]|uniref:Uncharacterized protein n=1 Tax=Edhazardia aedis (strain USNM 41457) TaxID=1003232 RepID=J9D119_EDHAE|nr:hypothetical protein EDEG_00519 [Edhazardia aedis USNM 41457]|eukprot:EJW01274.1 hypothetical protein EDEG_00519 [Edhazardia aedis USNM 41457]
MKFCPVYSMKFKYLFCISALFLLMFFLSFKDANSMSTTGISENRMISAPHIKSYERVLIEPYSSYRTTEQNVQLNKTMAISNDRKNENEESNAQQSTDKRLNTGILYKMSFGNFNIDLNRTKIKQIKHIQTDITKLKSLNIMTLKDFITNNNNTIFENFDVFGLFDILSKMKDREQVFYWKGSLHKMLTNYDLFKKIVEEKFSFLDKISLERDLRYISIVYDHHMYFRKAFNKFNTENSNSELAVYDFCKKEIELRPESLFSTEKSAFQENLAFVKKFNGIFDLFWKKFFLLLKENKSITFLDEDSMLNFYNINTKMSIPYDSYDYLNFNFGDIKVINSITLDVGGDKLSINLIYCSMTSRTYARVNHFNPIVFDYSFLTRLNMFLNTCKDLKLSNLYVTVDGQLRYSDAGRNLINKVSRFVRKRLSRLFKSYVDNSTIEFEFRPCEFLGDPEDNDAIMSDDKNKEINTTDASFISEQEILPRRDELNIFIHDWTACKLPKYPNMCNDCINGVNAHAGLYPDGSGLDSY